MTQEEKRLLKELASGKFDGLVGDEFYTTGGSTIWMTIEKGIPARFKEGPGGKFFDNRENVSFDGVRHILEKWSTDEQKLLFLRKFGWLMKDKSVQIYSAKFKPKK